MPSLMSAPLSRTHRTMMKLALKMEQKICASVSCLFSNCAMQFHGKMALRKVLLRRKSTFLPFAVSPSSSGHPPAHRAHTKTAQPHVLRPGRSQSMTVQQPIAVKCAGHLSLSRNAQGQTAPLGWPQKKNSNLLTAPGWHNRWRIAGQVRLAMTLSLRVLKRWCGA